MSTQSIFAAAAGTLPVGSAVVNRLGFGAMRIAGPGVWGPPADVDGACAVLRRAVELGVNFIDTADSYGPAVSEELIARALHPYPAGLVIATKGGLTRPARGRWDRNAQPRHLRTACEGSLKRLKVQRIDLYQLHAPDPHVPLEDSLGELAKLRSEGKIRDIGISNVSVRELESALAIVPIVSVQNRYNINDQGSDAVLSFCERAAMAFLPWAPLGSGSLADEDSNSAALQRIAAHHHVTMGQAAIAWLLARSPVMLPIPGTSSVAHLEQNVAAGAVRLAAAELR